MQYESKWQWKDEENCFSTGSGKSIGGSKHPLIDHSQEFHTSKLAFVDGVRSSEDVMLRLRDVLKALTGIEFADADQVISDAVIDSRLAIPSSMFVAIPGENVDGHDFIQDAIDRGAVVILVEREVETQANSIEINRIPSEEYVELPALPVCLSVDDTVQALQTIAKYWREKFEVTVVGITGSVGKSTTKELTTEVLQTRYRTISSPGNLNNEIGLPLSLLRMTEGCELAVLEMGFYIPGEIALLCDIAKPQIGVITNVSQVHLERAGSLDAIVEGKTELVRSLPSAPDGIAILNFDEPLVRQMSDHTQARIFYYGLTPAADLWASDIEGMGLDGVRFVFHYQGDEVHVRVPLLGRHSVHTALRAAAVGLVQGLTWHEIVGGLQESRSQLRLVAVQGPEGSLLLDDTYNAAPTSVLAALNLLSELEGRKIAVLGDMFELGEYEEHGHRMVGVRAAEIVDLLLTIGERSSWIADEAANAGLSGKKIIQLESNTQAIESLKTLIGEGDVVLIKGSRGMQMDQIVSAFEEEG
jgi:UDP-N-acetylmuramoyl-tripeptide--D-alanyl-D-alanine ligase